MTKEQQEKMINAAHKYWVTGLGLCWKFGFKEATGIEPNRLQKEFDESIEGMSNKEFKEWLSQFETK
tara:strand:- start:16 stop:216 length:201 start_codon:yes stop_codon:yes gene_type:complete